jgi:hypothetical protein
VVIPEADYAYGHVKQKSVAVAQNTLNNGDSRLHYQKLNLYLMGRMPSDVASDVQNTSVFSIIPSNVWIYHCPLHSFIKYLQNCTRRSTHV